MKKMKFILLTMGLLAMMFTFQSCLDDDKDEPYYQPTALVTVRPIDGGVTFQLDNNTTLYPSNLKKSPFGDKVVRALVNYTDEGTSGNVHSIYVNWIDSIRTKQPVFTLGTEEDILKYGDDPVEIVKDWVTIAEDGFLTLRIRTEWGPAHIPHILNLVTGVNPDDPFDLVLHHDAQGDGIGTMGDGLIAFDLNNLPSVQGQDVKVKLHWDSYSGEKTAEFDLHLNAPKTQIQENIPYNHMIE